MVFPQRYMLLTGNASSSYSALVRRFLPIANETFKLSTYGVVDPHMSERGRQGRLLVFSVLTRSRFSFGIDENTGYVENEDGSIRVVGSRGLLIYDHGANSNFGLTSVTTHYLSEGDIMTKDGVVTLPEWKRNCTINRTPPRPTNAIFDGVEFRTRLIQVSRFETDYKFTGYHGQNPIVEVVLERNSNSKSACGVFNGGTYTSIVNMKTTMGMSSIDRLPKGMVPKPNVEIKYIDN